MSQRASTSRAKHDGSRAGSCCSRADATAILVVGRRAPVCDYFGAAEATPRWPVPNEAGSCQDASTTPVAYDRTEWIDNFQRAARQVFGASDEHDAGLAWRYEADTTGNVVLCPGETPPNQFGDATIVDLESWGPSPNGTSNQGLRMAADLRNRDQSHRNGISWGIKWEFETPGLRTLLPTEPRTTLDFSPYDGVGFWARLAGSPPLGDTDLLVEFPTPATTEQASGGDGTCEQRGYCWAHLSQRITLDSTCWTRFEVPFDALMPEFGGVNPRLTANPATRSQVFGIEFAFNNTVAFPIDVIVTGIYLYSGRH